MIKDKIRSVLVIIFVCVLAATGNQTAKAGTVLNQTQVRNYLDTISDYQMSANSNPGYGSIGGEWTVMALARYGRINSAYIKKYKANLKRTLDDCNGVLSKRKYTEYSRVVLALTAVGENPADFEGYNLLSPLYDYEKVASQGANGMVYALLALDCGGYSVPVKDSEGKTVRDKILETIKRTQLSDGGWSYSGNSAEADMTAMVIQALTPYIKNEEIKIMTEKGFAALSELQNEDGGFSTMGVENCEAVAQVLTAMSEAGVSVDDSRFVKNGNTVLDALLEYYKDGAFSHVKGGGKNAMATDQAMYALVSYERKISKKNTLYNMGDGLVMIEEAKTKLTEDNGASKTSQTDNTAKAKDSEKNSVSNKTEGKSVAGTTVTEKKKVQKKNTDSNTKAQTEEILSKNNGDSEIGVSDAKKEASDQSETENGMQKKNEDKQADENIQKDLAQEEEDFSIAEERESASFEKANKKERENSGTGHYIVVIGAVILLGAIGVFIYNRDNIFMWIGKRNEK